MKKWYRQIPMVLGYLFLLCPIIIFEIGWLKWYFAAPLFLITGYSFWLVVKNWGDTDYWIIEKKDILVLAAALFIISVWVVLSGIGGLSYQTQDHEYRTAVFRALVEYDWPVLSSNGERGLIYYIGYWLPAALVGKVFGFRIGYWFQTLWAIAGIFIIYYFICYRRKKIELWPLLFLVFFSGMDYLGVWLLRKDGINILEAAHLEWWAVDFQYSSVTTQLYWVFNQSVPAWVATILILNEKNKKSILFITSLIMLSSTFPFVGMIPILLYIIFRDFNFRKKEAWSEVFTFQNIIGAGLICLITLLYLIGNVSANKGGVDVLQTNEYVDISGLLVQYILFCLIEFVIYFAFLYKYEKRNGLYYVLFVFLCAIPFVKVGGAHDFCMRASVPALFILMLWCMDSIEAMFRDKVYKVAIPFALFLLIGAITPFNEIRTSLRETSRGYEEGREVAREEVEIENAVLEGVNFSGDITDNFFYTKLAKNVDLQKQNEHLKDVKILTDKKKAYTSREEVFEDSYLDFCEEKIEDAQVVIKDLQNNEKDFMISTENLLALIENCEQMFGRLLREEYYCAGKFDGGIFYFTHYGDTTRYMSENILVLMKKGISLEEDAYLGSAESELLIFNPYEAEIQAQLVCKMTFLSEYANEELSMRAELDGQDIPVVQTETNARIEEAITCAPGTTSLRLYTESAKELYYYIVQDAVQTEYVYDAYDPADELLVIVEEHDVPFVSEEIIVPENPQKKDVQNVCNALSETDDKVLISVGALEKLLAVDMASVNDVLEKDFTFSKQKGSYMLFNNYRAKKKKDNEKTAYAAWIVEADEQATEKRSIKIYNPQSRALEVNVAVTIDQVSDLYDECATIVFSFGERVEWYNLQRGNTSVGFKAVLEPGMNEIDVFAKTDNYVYKDGQKLYYSIKKVKVEL